MNYPCKMIQDILPLYIDGVCSEESKRAVDEHLRECAECKDFFNSMRESDSVEIGKIDTEYECKKAVSFKTVKRKLFEKQMLAAVVAVVVLISAAALTVGILKNTYEVVAYDNNISVAMTDGALTGRLLGSMESGMKIKRVTGTVDGREINYLFFCVSDTKWDALVTGSDVFSEFVLCPADKGAWQIDEVCYFTGDYTGLENADSDSLQEIISASKVLWQK